MPTKTIEKAFPGKKADELYVAVEVVIKKLGQKFDIQCTYDQARRCIVVPEKMGVKGLCTVEDGKVKVAPFVERFPLAEINRVLEELEADYRERIGLALRGVE